MIQTAAVTHSSVVLDGVEIGEIIGLRFCKNNSTSIDFQDAAVRAHIESDFVKVLARFQASSNKDFSVGSDCFIRWLGVTIASLQAGDDFLHPKIILLADEFLTAEQKSLLIEDLQRIVRQSFEPSLHPLYALAEADAFDGNAAYIAKKIVENFGSIAKREILEEVRSLDKVARAALRHYGVRFGAYHLFIPALIKPAAAKNLTFLWALQNNVELDVQHDAITAPLLLGRTSLTVSPDLDPILYKLAGYKILTERAVRIDILERLADIIREVVQWDPEKSMPYIDGAYGSGRFFVTPKIFALLGATIHDMEAILQSIGYESVEISEKDLHTHLSQYTDAYKVEPKAEVEFVAMDADLLAAYKQKVLDEQKERSTNEKSTAPKTVLLWSRRKRVGTFKSRAQNNAGNRSRSTFTSANKAESGRTPSAKKFANNVGNFSSASFDGSKSAMDRAADGKAKSKRDFAASKKGRNYSKKGSEINLDSPFAKLLELKSKLKDS